MQKASEAIKAGRAVVPIKRLRTEEAAELAAAAQGRGGDDEVELHEEASEGSRSESDGAASSMDDEE